MLTKSNIIKLKQVQEVVELAFNIDDLFKKTRVERYVAARSLFFNYCYFEQKIVLMKLAKYSNLHHTTVLSSIRKFESYNLYYPYDCEISYFTSQISK